MNLCIINGPNLNLLGKRETNIYGNKTLIDLESEWNNWAKKNNVNLFIFQNNSEGKIIDFIYSKEKKIDGFIINPGALSHYSYSLRDCIASINKPFIEVHLSNIESRESFRKKSVITSVVLGKIFGFNSNSYILALEYFILKNSKNNKNE